MQYPFPVVISGYLDFDIFSIISAYSSKLIFFGSSLSTPKFGTDAIVALFASGVTVAIYSFEYAQFVIFSIQPFVTSVSEFKRITSFAEYIIPLFTVPTNPKFCSLSKTVIFNSGLASLYLHII